MRRVSMTMLLMGSLAVSHCGFPEDARQSDPTTTLSSPTSLQVYEKGHGGYPLPATATTSSGYPVDLTAWTSQSYPPVAGFPSGSWTLSPDHLSVLQNVNGQPMVYYSDFLAAKTVATVRVKVVTDFDNDFIGFAIGYQPGDTANRAANYLLVDWKQADQFYNFGGDAANETPGSAAFAGLVVSRVTGVPTADEFWGHWNFNAPSSDLTQGVVELARARTLGSVGWEDFREYEFRIEFDTSSLKIWVDGNLEFDLTGNFPNGRLAFYNLSQQQVVYSAFRIFSTYTVAADIKPAGCPNPINLRGGGVLPAALLGTKDFDVSAIDPASVRLIDPSAGNLGVAPLRYASEDVATPFLPLSPRTDLLDCTAAGPDGYADLTLKFDTDEVLAALAPMKDGETRTLKLIGRLFDGSLIEGEDVVVARGPKR